MVFSDTPDFVAWVTGRPTLWVPRDAFERLYASADTTAAASLALPPRRAVAGWFHENFRDPARPGALVLP